MEKLYNFLEYFETLPEGTREIILSKTQLLKHPKGHFLFRQGHVANHMYFMIKGIARVFHYKDGKEVINWFATDKQPFTAIDSFFSRNPSRYNIELLEDSEILAYTYDDLEELYARFHQFERIGRLITMQQFLILQERVDMIQFQNAKQRYETFIKRFPTVAQKVQLSHIASYLGISLETLSRIRAKY